MLRNSHTLIRKCPLMAQSRHRLVHCTCLLSEVKQTSSTSWTDVLSPCCQALALNERQQAKIPTPAINRNHDLSLAEGENVAVDVLDDRRIKPYLLCTNLRV